MNGRCRLIFERGFRAQPRFFSERRRVDSVTQILLGASIGEAVNGRNAGRRAAVWGGICGLLPDLDILIPFSDPVQTFTYHRGASHSILLLTVLTPLVVRLVVKWHPRAAVYRSRWYLLVYLAFITHILLDCLTVYGTQIFWPLKTPPVMGSTIFIIDPAYSLPLAAGVFAAVVLPRRMSQGHRINTFCLALSTLYLVWCIGVKAYVTDVGRESLRARQIGYQKLLTVPAPFNTLLWRVLAVSENAYYEGFYSIFDPVPQVFFQQYPRRPELLAGLAEHWPVKRLRWFTHGFYAVRDVGGDIVMQDLRMGLEPGYVFQFKVARRASSELRAVASERVPGRLSWRRLAWVWHRIWSPAPMLARIRRP